MFTKNNKEFRNLEEQVQKNKEDIANHYAIDRSLANFGIKIVGTISSINYLPDPLTYQGQYGDGFAVGQPGAYDYYIYTRPDLNAGQPNNYWLNVGSISVVGPQGPQGSQGPQGLPGISSKWYTGEYPSEPQENDMFLANNGEVFQYIGESWQPITDIKGPQGIPGIQGERGEQGLPGPAGQKGDTGDVGGFINIYGIVTDTNQLPSPATLNNLTVAYLLGSAVPYDLYIQVGENSASAQWVNSGPLNVSTLVSVNGQYQNIWNADTKVDKIDTKITPFKVFCENTLGAVGFGEAVTTPKANSLALYNTYGILQSYAPLNNLDVTNKQYVDKLKRYKHTVTGELNDGRGEFEFIYVNNRATSYTRLIDLPIFLQDGSTITGYGAFNYGKFPIFAQPAYDILFCIDTNGQIENHSGEALFSSEIVDTVTEINAEV